MLKKFWNVCVTIWWQWWDEGKWKLVDYLASHYDIVVRSGWWANAWHTLIVNWKKIVLHLIPSWILQWKQCIIWNWCAVDLSALLDEIHELDNAWIHSASKILISDRAHIVFSFFKDLDQKFEEMQKSWTIWTTKKWIWPTYMFKASRKWIRAWDIVYDFASFAIQFRSLCQDLSSTYWIDIDIEKELNICRDLVDSIEWMVCDTVSYLIKAKKDWKKILLEWAQWALLDIDHGTYPFVTSSNTTSAWALTWSWISYKDVSSVVAIVKAYTTRVWNWPFPSELPKEEAEVLRAKWLEYWATTWRPRRCGWLDLVWLKRVCEVSWVTSINITKLDILSWMPEIKVAIWYSLFWNEIDSIPIVKKDIENLELEYKIFKWWDEDISGVRNFSDLPKEAQDYIKFIEDFVWIPVSFIWVWAERDDFILRI